MRQLRIVILFCLTSNLWAQDAAPVRDGNWWRTETVRQQEAYICGLMDGINAEDFQARKGMSREAYVAMQETVYRLLRGLSVEQIRDGLTSFYSDFRNRNIRIAAAIWIVAMQAKGHNEERLAADVALLRSGRE